MPLTLAEAINITRKYGPLVIGRGNKLVLLSKPNGDCIFLRRIGTLAYCTIYPERPFVCRLYPFHVRLSPLKDAGDERKALYECEDGLRLYVYVDAQCEGVNSGGYPVQQLVPRVVRLWRQHMGV